MFWLVINVVLLAWCLFASGMHIGILLERKRHREAVIKQALESMTDSSRTRHPTSKER